MSESRARRDRARKALWIGVGLTALLYVIPLGGFVLYPLMLLSTLVHELGHGLTALCVGHDFDRFVMFSDGSGLATHSGQHFTFINAKFAQALISAGGLIGPAIVAAGCFIAARWARVARISVAVMAVAFAMLLALFVRNVFGIVFTGLVAAGLGWIAWRRTAEFAQATMVFLGVQLALSVFSRSDYLFVEEAQTGEGVFPSDVANMADALGGTYWLWGLVCAAFSIAVLLGGVFAFSRALKRDR